MLTGLREGSVNNLQLNAGLFLVNFDYSAAKNANELKELIADEILNGSGMLGATRGGGTFQAKPEVRQIDADGARYAYKGGMVNDRWVVKMTGTMLEVTPWNFANVLMCGDITRKNSVTTLRTRTDIRTGDYITHLCWVGDTNYGFVLIELDNALNLSGAAFTFTDRGEGTLPFEFQAHQESCEDSEYAPFRILFFEETGVVQ